MRNLSLALLVSSLCSCMVISNTEQSSSGPNADRSTLERLAVGTSADVLCEILGEPFSKVELKGGRAIWRWRNVTTETSNTLVMFLFLGSSERTHERHIAVEISDGKLVSSWTY